MLGIYGVKTLVGVTFFYLGVNGVAEFKILRDKGDLNCDSFILKSAFRKLTTSFREPFDYI